MLTSLSPARTLDSPPQSPAPMDSLSHTIDDIINSERELLRKRRPGKVTALQTGESGVDPVLASVHRSLVLLLEVKSKVRQV